MSLINDMLHDLARRERGVRQADVKPVAYSPLARAGALPSATGPNRQRWWRPLLWLNVLLSISLVTLAATWWVHRPAGWTNGPLAEKASVQASAPVAAASAVPAPGAEPAHPSMPAPGQATDSLAVASALVLPAPSTASSSLSAIVTAPQWSPPPVATRMVGVTPEAAPTAERPVAPRPVAPTPATVLPPPPVPTSARRVAASQAPSPSKVAERPANAPATKAPPVQAIAAAAAVGNAQQAEKPASAPAAKAPPVQVVAAAAAVNNAPRAERQPQAAAEPGAGTTSTRPTSGTLALAGESSVQWAESRLQQARTERKQGAHDAAVQSFKSLLQEQPQHVAARLELASLLLERKQPSAAADLLSEGLMLLPRQTSFTLALAPLWIQAGQQTDAMALLEQGTRHASPKDGPYHAYYASQLLKLKRPVQAQQHFELAVASDPGRGEWLLGLGLALQANGKTQEAIAALQRASASGQLAPQNKAMVEQAIARLQKGS